MFQKSIKKKHRADFTQLCYDKKNISPTKLFVRMAFAFEKDKNSEEMNVKNLIGYTCHEEL